MKNKTTLETIASLLCKVISVKAANVDETGITADMNLSDDLGLTSLDAIQLLVMVEEEFGIEIPDRHIMGFVTVGDIADYLQKQKENIFSIKTVAPGTEDYVRAVNIHSNQTKEDVRIDPGTIEYWFNNPTDEMEVLPYGLYEDNRVIGFCLLTVYKTERFGCLECLAISENVRTFKVYGIFLNFLKEKIQKLPLEYVLIESAADGSLESMAMERLLKASGAGVLDCRHILPVFDGTYTAIPARIMIYPKPESIGKKTYLKCLHTLLHKGYRDWFSPFINEDEKTAYARNISELYSELEKTLPDVICVL